MARVSKNRIFILTELIKILKIRFTEYSILELFHHNERYHIEPNSTKYHFNSLNIFSELEAGHFVAWNVL
jgi:hypothetical protein